MNKPLYVFGGTFDPLTLAHEGIMKSLKSHDFVVLISDIDKTPFLPFNARKNLVQNFLDKNNLNPAVIAQDCRTYEFVHKTFADRISDVVLVVGADEWDNILQNKWEHSDKLLNEFKFKVMDRSLNGPSSSKARELLKEKNSQFKNDLNKVISKDVYDLIARKYLKYFTEESNDNRKYETTQQKIGSAW